MSVTPQFSNRRAVAPVPARWVGFCHQATPQPDLVGPVHGMPTVSAVEPIHGRLLRFMARPR